MDTSIPISSHLKGATGLEELRNFRLWRLEAIDAENLLDANFWFDPTTKRIKFYDGWLNKHISVPRLDKTEKVVGEWTFDRFDEGTPPFLVGPQNNGVTVPGLSSFYLQGWIPIETPKEWSIGLRKTGGRLEVGDPISGKDALNLDWWNTVGNPSLPTYSAGFGLTLTNRVFAVDVTANYVGNTGWTKPHQFGAGLYIANGASIKFFGPTNSVGLKAPAGLNEDVIWSLPVIDAVTPKHYMRSDGFGKLSFAQVKTSELLNDSGYITVDRWAAYPTIPVLPTSDDVYLSSKINGTLSWAKNLWYNHKYGAVGTPLAVPVQNGHLLSAQTNGQLAWVEKDWYHYVVPDPSQMLNDSAGKVLTFVSILQGIVTMEWRMPTAATVTSIVGTANVIRVDKADTVYTVDIDDNYVGQTSIKTLGIVDTGVWRGTPVGIDYGGTGLNKASYGLGDILYYSGSATQLTPLRPQAAGMFLRLGAARFPEWSGYAMPLGVSVNSLFVGSGVTTVVSLESVANSVLTTNGAGTVAWAPIVAAPVDRWAAYTIPAVPTTYDDMYLSTKKTGAMSWMRSVWTNYDTKTPTPPPPVGFPTQNGMLLSSQTNGNLAWVQKDWYYYTVPDQSQMLPKDAGRVLTFKNISNGFATMDWRFPEVNTDVMAGYISQREPMGGLAHSGSATSPLRGYTGGPTLNIGLSDFTVAFVVRFSDYRLASGAILLNSHSAGKNIFYTYFATGDILAFTFAHNNGYHFFNFPIDIPLVNGQAYTVIISCDRDGLATLYINGSSDRNADAIKVAVNVSAAAGVDIGRDNNNTWSTLGNVVGVLHAFRIYNYALNDAEVLELTQTGTVAAKDQWGTSFDISAPVMSPTLLNGGFDTPGAGGPLDNFALWTEQVQGGATTISRETIEHYNGTACFKAVTDASANYWNLFQAAFTTGKAYRMSFWMKGTAGKQLNFGTGGSLQLSWIQTAGWTFYSVEFIATGTLVNFACTQASAVTFIDDITVTPIPIVISPNINNGGFETAGAGGPLDNFATWAEATTGTSTIIRDTTEFHSGVASLKGVTDASGNYWNVYYPAMTIGRTYRLTFWAKGSAGALLTVFIGAATGWDVPLTASWAQYTYEAVPSTANISFACFGVSKTINLDDVVVTDVTVSPTIANGAVMDLELTHMPIPEKSTMVRDRSPNNYHGTVTTGIGVKQVRPNRQINMEWAGVSSLALNSVVYTGAGNILTGLLNTGSMRFLTQAGSAAPVWTDLFVGPNTWTGTQNFQGADITVRTNPLSSLSAVNQSYVDSKVASGFRVLPEVDVATTTNLAFYGVQNIDGVTGVANMRVLAKSQTNLTQNGIYVMGTGNWARADDCNDPAEITVGAYVYVKLGTTNGGTSWSQTQVVVTMGVSNIVWQLFSRSTNPWSAYLPIPVYPVAPATNMYLKSTSTGGLSWADPDSWRFKGYAVPDKPASDLYLKSDSNGGLSWAQPSGGGGGVTGPLDVGYKPTPLPKPLAGSNGKVLSSDDEGNLTWNDMSIGDGLPSEVKSTFGPQEIVLMSLTTSLSTAVMEIIVAAHCDVGSAVGATRHGYGFTQTVLVRMTGGGGATGKGSILIVPGTPVNFRGAGLESCTVRVDYGLTGEMDILVKGQTVGDYNVYWQGLVRSTEV